MSEPTLTIGGFMFLLLVGYLGWVTGGWIK